MMPFDTRTGEYSRITGCGCDIEINSLEEKLADEAQVNAILVDALVCITEVTEEDPVKIAQETLESIAHRR